MIIFIICSTLNSIFILLICLMWFCWVFSSYILVILKRVHASGMLERISFDFFCIIHRKGAARILRGGCQVRFKGIFNLQSANACCGIRRFFGVATCTTRNICQMRLLPLNTPKQFGDRFLRYQIFSKGEFLISSVMAFASRALLQGLCSNLGLSPEFHLCQTLQSECRMLRLLGLRAMAPTKRLDL